MLGGEQWLPAVLLWVGLPWFRLGVRYPVLTDATAMLFALLSVILLPVSIPLAVVSAVIAGACRESAPVYAALFSLSPWPLLALPAVLAAHFLTRKGEIPIGADWLHKPFKSAWDFHGGKWLDAKWTLLPWGAALIAVLNPQFWTALPALAVAYGTMLVANDFARLYQWAAPPVVILAAQMVPELSIIGVGFTIFALILLHFWNPYANIDV
jgi:hypothetical protein